MAINFAFAFFFQFLFSPSFASLIFISAREKKNPEKEANAKLARMKLFERLAEIYQII